MYHLPNCILVIYLAQVWASELVPPAGSLASKCSYMDATYQVTISVCNLAINFV